MRAVTASIAAVLVVGYFPRLSVVEMASPDDLAIGRYQVSGSGKYTMYVLHTITGRCWIELPNQQCRSSFVWAYVANGQSLVLPAIVESQIGYSAKGDDHDV